MGNTHSTGLNDDESLFGGWTQAVGIAPAWNNQAMWGSAGYPVIPTNPHSTTQPEVNAALSHHSASTYGTPAVAPGAYPLEPQMVPTPTSFNHDPRASAPGHVPIPLPDVQSPGPPISMVGTEAPSPAVPSMSAAGTRSRFLTPSSRLSSIQDLRGLRGLGSSRARVISLPSSRHGGSLRQSSLESNGPTPRVHPRSVHFASTAQTIVPPPVTMQSPGLSTVMDSPSPGASIHLIHGASDCSPDDESQTASSTECPSTPDLCSQSKYDSTDTSFFPTMHVSAAEWESDMDVATADESLSHVELRQRILVAAVGEEDASTAVVLPTAPATMFHGVGDVHTTVSPVMGPTTAPPSTPHVHNTRSTPSPQPSPRPPSPQQDLHAQQPAPLPLEPPSSSHPTTAYSSPAINVQGTRSYGPSVMHHPGTYASPNGVLYHNWAAAAGFGVGTPYQPQLPTDQYNNSTWQHPPSTAISQPQTGAEAAYVLRAIYVYRGSHRSTMSYDAWWDDARLLEEMRKTYDQLRSWRKWLSLKNVRSITLVSVSTLVE